MRKLTLRKEVLTELSTAELTAVAGAGSRIACPTEPSCITPQPSRQLNCTFSLGPDVCGG